MNDLFSMPASLMEGIPHEETHRAGDTITRMLKGSSVKKFHVRSFRLD
ncbi:hypothetical protein [Salinicoccus sediminis]|nr:hypothetical protein [Salinicoccus sediminis]